MILGIMASLALAQGIPLKDGSSSTLWSINANKAGEVVLGKSTKATYICSASALTATSAYTLALESDSTHTTRILGWCVGVPNATAATGVTVTLQRRTTASSAGTAATAEGTSSPAVSKLDEADGNFAGVCRQTGTLGTAGAVLDQHSVQVGELGAGAADPPSIAQICRQYGFLGEKPVVIAAGTSNGVSLSVSAPGSGAVSAGSISILFTVE